MQETKSIYSWHLVWCL